MAMTESSTPAAGRRKHMETIRTAICDDSAEEILELKKLIHSVGPSDIHLDAYTNAQSLLDRIDAGAGYDLVFLDIYMRDLNGIETAKELLKRLPDVEIVFVTVSREHAVDAFTVNALHYLLKPATPRQMDEIFTRYERKKERSGGVIIRSGKENFHLRADQIFYIQSQNNGTDIYTENGILHSGMKTATIGEQLPGVFLHIRRGMYINMNYIRRMETDSCVLKNGERVLLSRKGRAEIRGRYKEFIYGTIQGKEV